MDVVGYLTHQAPEHGVASVPVPEATAQLPFTIEETSARYLVADGTTVAPVAGAAISVDASAEKHPRVRLVGGRVRHRDVAGQQV